MTLRVYFHIDDTDHDFVHARARQQRLYYIIALVYVTVLALDFFILKKLQIIRKYATLLQKKYRIYSYKMEIMASKVVLFCLSGQRWPRHDSCCACHAHTIACRIITHPLPTHSLTKWEFTDWALFFSAGISCIEADKHPLWPRLLWIHSF